MCEFTLILGQCVEVSNQGTLALIYLSPFVCGFCSVIIIAVVREELRLRGWIK